MSTLLGKFISETYTGVLHSDGTLGGTGVHLIYDGSGNASALSLGQANQGATITGTLNATNLNVGALAYPSVAENNGDILVQKSANSVGFVDKLPQANLDVSGVSGGSSTRPIMSMDVSPQGTITYLKRPETVREANRIKFSANPDAQETVSNLGNDWKVITIVADDLMKDYLVRGLIVYMEKTSSEPLSAGKVEIRCTRRTESSSSEPGGADTYDSDGHHCFKFDSGTYVGCQFTTCVTPVEYNKENNPDSSILNQYSFKIRDLGNVGADWKLSVQAFIY